MTLKYLLQKEFIQIKRNSFLPRLILIFPIMVMCVMPWVMNMEVKNVVVEVVDNDRSTLSRRLVHSIEASNYFIFRGQSDSYDKSLESIESCEADIVVVVPRGYEKEQVRGGAKPILIAANAVNGTKGGLGSAYLGSMISSNSGIKNIVDDLYLYNKNLNYKRYMIPGLMGILIMMLCGFLPALNIVGEKEKGTIEQINVTPISRSLFILAKLIPYWLIGMITMTICFVLSWLIYGISAEGNLLYIYLLAILLCFVFSSIGLVVSNISDTMQQAMFVMWFIVVCMMLLGGLFTPVRSMPEWAQILTYANPMRYFIEGIRTVFVRGGTWQSISNDVCLLSFFSFVIGSLAVATYKKRS